MRRRNHGHCRKCWQVTWNLPLQHVLPHLSNATRHDPGRLLADAHLFEMVLPWADTPPDQTLTYLGPWPFEPSFFELLGPLELYSSLGHTPRLRPADTKTRFPTKLASNRKAAISRPRKPGCSHSSFKCPGKRLRHWNLECGFVWGVKAEIEADGRCRPCPGSLHGTWNHGRCPPHPGLLYSAKTALWFRGTILQGFSRWRSSRLRWEGTSPGYPPGSAVTKIMCLGGLQRSQAWTPLKDLEPCGIASFSVKMCMYIQLHTCIYIYICEYINTHH